MVGEDVEGKWSTARTWRGMWRDAALFCPHLSSNGAENPGASFLRKFSTFGEIHQTNRKVKFLPPCGECFGFKCKIFVLHVTEIRFNFRSLWAGWPRASLLVSSLMA